MLKGKKVLSLLLALCLTAGTLSTLAFAVPGDSPTVTLSSIVSPSGILTATVKAELPEANSSLTSVGVYVVYDTTKLTLLDSDGKTELTTAKRADTAVIPKLTGGKEPYTSISELNLSGNKGCIFVSLIPKGDEVNALNASQELFQLKFKVKGEQTEANLKNSVGFADAKNDKALIDSNKIGSKTLTTSLMSHVDAIDYYEGVIGSFKPSGVKLTAALAQPVVQKFALGDVTNDGDITSEDMQAVYEHISGFKTLSDIYYADTNKDGDITSEDMQKIYEHISGIASLTSGN